jgi:hypothetical protein
MAQLLVGGLEDKVVQALEQKAAETESLLKRPTGAFFAWLCSRKDSKKALKNSSSKMPGGGDDALFERRRSWPALPREAPDLLD